METVHHPHRLILVVAVCVSALFAQVESRAAEAQQVVVHLSHYSDDLHAANMALKVSTMLAESGASVTLFVDLEGVRLVDERIPQDLRWGTTSPVSGLYGKATAAGVRILVCTHCAKAAGIAADNLREGSYFAKDEELAAMFMAADKVIDF